MKTIAVTKRSRAVNALLEHARDEDVLVEAGDGTRYLLSAIDDFTQEIEAQRRNKELMALLDERAKETEWIPLEEVDQQLGLRPRKPQKKRPGRQKSRKH